MQERENAIWPSSFLKWRFRAEPNRPLLDDAVRKFAPFRNEIVFVGGITLGLLITAQRPQVEPRYAANVSQFRAPRPIIFWKLAITFWKMVLSGISEIGALTVDLRLPGVCDHLCPSPSSACICKKIVIVFLAEMAVNVWRKL
jgi:hypothetical protein